MILCKSVAPSSSSQAQQTAGHEQRTASCEQPSVSQTEVKRRRGAARGGFTLLEVLIATAVTLIMMISLAQIFKIIGDSMQQGRSVLQLNNQLRNVVYRLRSDLDHLTVIPVPPIDPSTGQGYLQIFDGSITDFTAGTKVLEPVSNSVGQANRFGDVDDILMGTVRAGDVWFTGKVPRYIVEKRAPDRNVLADFEMLSIASQHAEVAVFLQPLVTSLDNPNRDPAVFLNSPQGAVDFEDNDMFPNFPDGFRLHYRTLLIRPDLNLTTDTTISDLSSTALAGTLPGGVMNGSISLSGNNENWTITQQWPGLATPLPSPLCDMALAHQQCDLSMRRVFNTGGGGFDFVAANSLQDLVDPANRFAHVQVPLPNSVSTTMPVLALGRSLSVTSDPNGTLGTSNFQVGSGFLHPAFVLMGNRAGEDMLASDILAFDIKLFDPDVALISSAGRDLVLSPNDPGYASIVNSGDIVSRGEYVDLAWAKKMKDHFSSVTIISPDTRGILSSLSGFSTGTAFTNALIKSGNIHGLKASGTALLLQPTYDTYTTSYEGDGVLQAELDGRTGVCRINGAVALYGASGNDSSNLSTVDAWRTAADMGTDGIDNSNSFAGVDDPSEMETSPPFPMPLRGLKISVRMEDPATRQVKQMSAAKEFVSH